MRNLLLVLLGAVCAGCIAPKKVDLLRALHEDQVRGLNTELAAQRDSINDLARRLERARGGNEALLRAQSQLEDKLVSQKDQLDALEGNLSNTSARLSKELTATRGELKAARLAIDSLRTAQRRAVADFRTGLELADSIIYTALADTLPADAFRTEVTGGELILSVQEDVLFRPRATERLADGSELVLRAVMDALQSDPRLKLTVVGHTDNQPNPRRGTDNRTYASLRAITLATTLADTYYLSPNRVMTASYGEYRPVQSNASAAGQRSNRRMDFVLTNNVGNLLRTLRKLNE